MQIEMKNLTQQWKNGSAELRGSLQPQIEALNNKLKAADATLGNHQRNVGNYANSIKDVTMKVSGLSGIMSIFGRIIGIDTEQLQALQEIHSTLREGSRDLTHLTHEHSEAVTEETVVTEAQTVANEELAASEEAALGPIGWLLIGITALGAGILGYIEISKEAKKREEEYSKAMDGTIIVDEKLRKAYNESIIELGKLDDEYAVIMGTMDKFQAKENDLVRNHKKDVADLVNDEKKQIDEASNGWGKRLAAAFGLYAITGQMTDKEVMKIRTDALTEFAQKQNKLADEIRNNAAEAHKEAVKELEEEAKKKEEKRKKDLKEYEEANKQRLEAIKEMEKKTLESMAKIDEADLKEAESRQKELDILIKYNEEMDKLHDKMVDNHLLEEQSMKIRADKLQMEIDKNDPKKLATDKKQLQADTFADYDLKAESKKKQLADAARAESEKAVSNIKDPKERAAREKQIYDDLIQAEKDADNDAHLKKLEYIEKEKQAKAKASKDTIKQGLQGVKTLLEGENKLRAKSLEEQMSNLQQQVDQDSALNAAGRKNGLAQAMRAENSIAVQQMNLQTQSEGINSAMSLANILLNLQKSGGFYEGTPDTGGPGGLDNKGGMLAMLHPNEAVIPKARNEQYPGLAKAWISGNLDTYLAKLAMPEVQSVDMKEVKQELGEIKEAIKNQSWGIAYPTKDGAVIEEHSGDTKRTRIIEEPLTIRTV